MMRTFVQPSLFDPPPRPRRRTFRLPYPIGVARMELYQADSRRPEEGHACDCEWLIAFDTSDPDLWQWTHRYLLKTMQVYCRWWPDAPNGAAWLMPGSCIIYEMHRIVPALVERYRREHMQPRQACWERAHPRMSWEIAAAWRWRIDPYLNACGVLNVPPNADAATIKAAYRRLAVQHHPDRGGSHNHMTAINAAYALLTKQS